MTDDLKREELFYKMMDEQYAKNGYLVFIWQLFFGTISFYVCRDKGLNLLSFLIVLNGLIHILVLGIGLKYEQNRRYSGLCYFFSATCIGIMFVNFGLSVSSSSTIYILITYLIFSIVMLISCKTVEYRVNKKKIPNSHISNTTIAIVVSVITAPIIRRIMLDTDTVILENVIFYLSVLLGLGYTIPASRGIYDYIKRGKS